jgi:hypothetical protein
MQKSEMIGKCPNVSHTPERQHVHAIIDKKVHDRAMEDIEKRGEKNLSDIIGYLLTCWHYSHDNDCEHCPFYEEESDGKDS